MRPRQRACRSDESETSKDRSANGTSASDGRAGRITRSNSRSWSGWMRPDRGGAEVLPVHAQGRIGLVGSAKTGLETALLTGRPHRGMESRQRLWMSITGSSSIRRLNDCPVESGPERARPSRRVACGRETTHLLGERGQIGHGDRPSRQLSSAGSLPAGGPAARHRSARRLRRSRTHGDARGD